MIDFLTFSDGRDHLVFEADRPLGAISGRVLSPTKNIGCSESVLFSRAANGVSFRPFALSISNARLSLENRHIVDASCHLIRNDRIDWQAGPDPEEEFIHFSRDPQKCRHFYLPGKTLYLDSVWGHSFFHFISETLGKVYVSSLFLGLENYDNVIVPSPVARFVADWFGLLGISNACIIPSGCRYDNILAESLVLPSYSQHCGWLSRELIDFVKLNLGDALSPISAEDELKIVVGRRGKRQILNQDEIMAKAASRGFSLVYLEDLSVLQQAKLFASACCVIAPHGAGLTNLIYCRPGTRVFEFFGRSYQNACFYGICGLIGLSHAYHISDSCEDGDGSFCVKPEVLDIYFSEFVS